MFKTYFIYLLKKYTLIFMVFTAIFSCISFLIAIISFSSNNALYENIIYALMGTVISINQLLLFIIIFSFLYFLYLLKNNNEFIIMENSSISSFKIIFPVILFVLLLSLIKILILDYYDAKFSNILQHNTYASHLNTKKTYWIKDKLNGLDSFIKFQKNNDNNLTNISFFFIKNNKLSSLITAKTAKISHDTWRLKNVTIADTSELLTHKYNSFLMTSMSSFTINKFIENIDNENPAVHIWELPKIINRLNVLSINTIVFKSNLDRILNFPLLVISILFIYLNLMRFFSKRANNWLLGIVLVGTIFFIYFINSFVNLIIITEIVPTYYRWFLPVFYILIALNFKYLKNVF